MEAKQTVHIAPLLDDMKIGRYHIGIFILCFVTLFLDGMDFAAVLVAAPAILRDWQLEPKVMGTIFGAGNLGLLIGAVAFGKLGDVYRRRIGIIAGVLTYSLPALATAFADSYEHLLALRFLTCIGIGGVLPNIVTLLTEGAPKRVRGSSVMLALIGYALGPAAVGGLAAFLIPRTGWPSVFLVVGIAGTLLGILLYFVLPESIRYLALKKPQSEELRQALRRIAPDLAIAPQTQFVLGDTSQKKLVLADLFRDRLATITPLLWAVFFVETLTFMTLVSWVPILLQRSGVSPAMASLAFAYGAVGGVIAQLLLSRFIDSFGRRSLRARHARPDADRGHQPDRRRHVVCHQRAQFALQPGRPVLSHRHSRQRRRARQRCRACRCDHRSGGRRSAGLATVAERHGHRHGDPLHRHRHSLPGLLRVAHPPGARCQRTRTRLNIDITF